MCCSFQSFKMVTSYTSELLKTFHTQLTATISLFRLLSDSEKVVAMGWIRAHVTVMNQTVRPAPPNNHQAMPTDIPPASNVNKPTTNVDRSVAVTRPPDTGTDKLSTDQSTVTTVASGHATTVATVSRPPLVPDTNTVSMQSEQPTLLSYIPLNFSEFRTLNPAFPYPSTDFGNFSEDQDRSALNTPEPLFPLPGCENVEVQQGKSLAMIENKPDKEDAEVIKILQSAVQDICPTEKQHQGVDNASSACQEVKLRPSAEAMSGNLHNIQPCVTAEPVGSNNGGYYVNNEASVMQECGAPFKMITPASRDHVLLILNDVMDCAIAKVEAGPKIAQHQKRKRGRAPKRKTSQESPDTDECPRLKNSAEKSKRKNPNPRKVEKSKLDAALMESGMDSCDDSEVNSNVKTDCKNSETAIDEPKGDVMEDVTHIVKKDENGYDLRQDHLCSVAQKLGVTRKPHKNIVRHTCRLCQKNFTHGRPFKTHIQNHTRSELCCRTCRSQFVNPALFLHHDCMNLELLALPPSHVCPHCSFTTNSARKLSLHIRGVHKLQQAVPIKKCSECGELFSKRIDLYKHHQEAHYPGQAVCLKCGKIAATVHEIEMHARKEHAHFICVICSETFYKKSLFAEHMSRHTDITICPVCGKDHLTRELVIEHCQTAHSVDLRTGMFKKYQCAECYECFPRPSLLQAHLRKHTGEKPIRCEVCKVCFRTSKALLKHRQSNTHRIKAGDLPKHRDQMCYICGKSYFRKQSLQRHMRYHSGTKPYKCQYCDYSCQEQNNLKRHQALHFSVRQFVCDLCGAAFHVKKTLETHCLYKHSDEKNYSCDECDRSFKAPNALKRHMLIHRNIKNHKCNICEKAFNRQYNLRRHMINVHHNEESLPPTKKVKLLDVPPDQAYSKSKRLCTPKPEKEATKKLTGATRKRVRRKNSKSNIDTTIKSEQPSAPLLANYNTMSFLSDSMGATLQPPTINTDALMTSPVHHQQYATSTSPIVANMFSDITTGLSGQTSASQGLFPDISCYGTLGMDPVPPASAEVASTDGSVDYTADSYQLLHLMQAHPNTG